MGTVKIILKNGVSHEVPRENLRNIERLMAGKIDYIEDPQDAPEMDEIIINDVGGNEPKTFGEMTRDEIKAEADKLGVEYHKTISTKLLVERIEEKLATN